MKIWLINPYGPIPGEGWREYRFTMIGKVLAENGHQVTWWTANFSHHFKRFRSVGWIDLTVSPNFRIRIVPTLGYQKHIGLSRIRFEILYAWKMYHRAKRESPPDCIIAADPPQTTGFLAVRLSKRFRVPVVLDVLDLWPEIFVLAFPRLLKPLVPIICYPIYILRRYNLRRADAVTSSCDTNLEVVKKEAHHLQKASTIFIGIDVIAFRALIREIGNLSPAIMQKTGIKDSGEVWAVYAGTLGNNYDIHTLLQVADHLKRRKSRIRILIAGEGPLRKLVTDFIETQRLTNLVYLGKLGPEELIQLYQLCDIGLCTYGPDSTVGMPVKAYDFMAAGLPIVNSLRGELEKFLRENQIGIQYVAGDANSLATAIEELASDPDKRRAMAENSYKAAMMFDKKTQYPKFIDVLQQVTSQ